MAARAARAVLAVLAGAARAAAGPAAPPLTAEDVVRLFAAGVPPGEIAEQIRARQVDFALDAEMLDELRAAGLPEPLLAAMLARQAEAAPVPAAAEPPAAERPFHTLTVGLRLRSAATAGGVLRVSAALSDAFARTLELAIPPGGVVIEDVAIFLACLTPTHVPDQWRNRSPLGHDFVSMARHQLLAFVSGARTVERDGAARQLELDLPERLEVGLEPDATHDLWLGVALEVDGRYHRLAHAAWDGLVLDRARQLEATLDPGRGGRLEQLALRFERDPPRDPREP